MGLRTHIHRNPLIRWEFNKIRYENWANQSRSVWIDAKVEWNYDTTDETMVRVSYLIS